MLQWGRAPAKERGAGCNGKPVAPCPGEGTTPTPLGTGEGSCTRRRRGFFRLPRSLHGNLSASTKTPGGRRRHLGKPRRANPHDAAPAGKPEPTLIRPFRQRAGRSRVAIGERANPQADSLAFRQGPHDPQGTARSSAPNGPKTLRSVRTRESPTSPGRGPAKPAPFPVPDRATEPARSRTRWTSPEGQRRAGRPWSSTPTGARRLPCRFRRTVKRDGDGCPRQPHGPPGGSARPSFPGPKPLEECRPARPDALACGNSVGQDGFARNGNITIR